MSQGEIDDALADLRRTYGGMEEVPDIADVAWTHLVQSGVSGEVAANAVKRWRAHLAAPSCTRCGGSHDARECEIQDVVREIEDHVRVHGPTPVYELQAHLERNLGAPRDIAQAAMVRRAPDNDA